MAEGYAPAWVAVECRAFESLSPVHHWEAAMYARVWQLRLRPGKVQDFEDAMSDLVSLARRQPGYYGVLALRAGRAETPDVTLVAVWDSLDAIRASEKNLFLMQAITRYVACCEGVPHVTESEVLASDFVASAAAG
jgi:antibiotic biosynthesis monooxygenase (ABM) superfamily enzyme